MPTPTFVTTVPANGVAFPLTGSVFEFMQYDGLLELAIIQQTGTIGQVLATVNSGPETLQEEGPIPTVARFPLYPDDYYIRDEVAAGDRLRVQLRNTTGAGIVVVTALNLTPAAVA